MNGWWLVPEIEGASIRQTDRHTDTALCRAEAAVHPSPPPPGLWFVESPMGRRGRGGFFPSPCEPEWWEGGGGLSPIPPEQPAQAY